MFTAAPCFSFHRDLRDLSIIRGTNYAYIFCRFRVILDSAHFSRNFRYFRSIVFSHIFQINLQSSLIIFSTTQEGLYNAHYVVLEGFQGRNFKFKPRSSNGSPNSHKTKQYSRAPYNTRLAFSVVGVPCYTKPRLQNLCK